MDGQGAGLTESLPTFLTFERFFLGVDISVVSQMVLSPESLVTNIACVWPLVRVGPLMDEEIVGLGEMPATELANKLLFSLGRKSAPGGFSVGGQLAQLGDGSP